jgi:hypothetical protein
VTEERLIRADLLEKAEMVRRLWRISRVVTNSGGAGAGVVDQVGSNHSKASFEIATIGPPVFIGNWASSR